MSSRDDGRLLRGSRLLRQGSMCGVILEDFLVELESRRVHEEDPRRGVRDVAVAEAGALADNAAVTGLEVHGLAVDDEVEGALEHGGRTSPIFGTTRFGGGRWAGR